MLSSFLRIVLSRDGVQGKGRRLSPFPWPALERPSGESRCLLHAEHRRSSRNRSRLACCIATAASVSDWAEA